MTPTRFKKTVSDFYRTHKRIFPWRETKDPYRILLSEIMLQQTQTARVIEKYNEWLREFPTFQTLAEAPLPHILKVWQGLGYNRRALALHRLAKEITHYHNGNLPKTFEELIELPGIGPYTAGAVMAFAFNKPLPIIETNIRTVYIHHFFPEKEHAGKKVSDTELLPLIQKTLDQKNPREWYWALMDYGASIKKTHGNASRRSAHHIRQSPFKGSNREVRSAILKAVQIKPQTARALATKLTTSIGATPESIDKNLIALENEGFLARRGRLFIISSGLPV